MNIRDFKANDARDIVDSKLLSVLRNIKNMSELGHSEYTFYEKISSDVMNDLLGRGFVIDDKELYAIIRW